MGYFDFRFLLIMLCSCLYGCTRFSVYPPDVKLAGITIAKVTLVQQDFNLLIDITNTENKAIFVRTINYSLKVNGLLLAEGDDFVWKTIPAKGVQQVSIKVSANLWGQLLPLFQTAKSNQQLSYYFSGKLVTGNLFFRRVTDIHYSGELTPEQIPVKYINKLQKYQKLFKKT